MSLSSDLTNVKVLLVGLGGLGCPTALGLTSAGVGSLFIAEDDAVEETNLHRQILYREADVGRDKLDAGIAALRRLCPDSPTRLVPLRTRILPDNARELVQSVDLVVEGSDNFATKFLVNDACHLERRPHVQGAAVRWVTTAFCVGAESKPCYRCLFEDVPRGVHAPNCAEAGVMGPVVGMGAALLVELALGFLHDRKLEGTIGTYDGRSDRLRWRKVAPRTACPLCGTGPSDLRHRLRSLRCRVLHRVIEAPPTKPATNAQEPSIPWYKFESRRPFVSSPKARILVTAQPGTVRAALDELETQYPGIKARLLDDKGVRRFVNVYLGEEDIRFLQGLDTELKAGDELTIVPAIAGGR
ncbi:MAG: ThiF family adenylyltransferase [Polyangiaceae bacterium]